MFNISDYTFRCQINQLITRQQLEDKFHNIQQLPIPITLNSIIVQNYNYFEDQPGKQMSIDLPNKLYIKICEILQNCHIYYLSVVQYLGQNLLHKLVNRLSQHCRFITSLDFSSNQFGCQGIKLLCQSDLVFIKHLILKRSVILDYGVELLTQNRWKYLTILDLGHNGITNKGLKSIIKSKSMPKLQELLLDKIRTTRDGLKIFSKHCWSLKELSLNDCQGNGQIVKVISRIDCSELVFIKIRKKSQFLYAGWMAKVNSMNRQQYWPYFRPTFHCYGQFKNDGLTNQQVLLNMKKRMIKSY